MINLQSSLLKPIEYVSDYQSLGEMFRELNAIETSSRSSAGLGFAGHEKAAYMSKYIPQYEPSFMHIEDKEELTEVRITLETMPLLP